MAAHDAGHDNPFGPAVRILGHVGIVISSAFPAIVVYARELIPGRTGLISGLFFGLIFGVGGIGAAVLGSIAGRSGIQFVYQLCALLPLIGLLTALLPNIESGARNMATIEPRRRYRI